MRKTIIDISEMSDSKEFYGRRPNKAIPIFIYILVGLLAAALIYSFVGKIEIVATAKGMVRPNEDVSNVSSLLGGRVEEVLYKNGQKVKKGDKLLSIDTSEQEIALKGLIKTRDDYEMQIAMLNKFIKGLERDKNPFSSDTNSKEYPYYIQYRDYELNKKNSDETFTYNKETAQAQIEAARDQIGSLNKQIAGLNAYKKSVKNGKNMLSAYPEYENMYKSYQAALKGLKTDYNTNKSKILSDTTAKTNAGYLDSYKKQLSAYDHLISSIKAGESKFTSGDAESIKLLYDNYKSSLAGYDLAYESAKQTYDMAKKAADSAAGTAVIGETETGISTGTSAEDQLKTAKTQMDSAKAALDTFKTKTLADYAQAKEGVQDKVKELRATIASTQDKDKALRELEASYKSSVDQQKTQTLSQIDSSLKTAKEGLVSAKSSLKVNQVAGKLYDNSVDEDGKPLTLSISSVEQIAAQQAKIDSIKPQLESAKNQIDQAQAQIKQGGITAPQDGTINEVTAVTKGDALGSGTVFATIIPSDESVYSMDIYVNNSDIGNIEKGDTVRYNLEALPSNQYGDVKGKVISISKDTLIQNGQYSGLYLIKGSIGNVELKDKDGNVGKVAIGMEAACKIVTERKSIFRFLLEKINLK